MNGLIEFLNTFGIHVDNKTPDVIILSGYYLILSVIVLINVVNIMFYLGCIYILSNEKLINKIPSKYVYVHKILIFYKNIRVVYIISEFVLLLMCLFIMIGTGYSLVSFYINLK